VKCNEAKEAEMDIDIKQVARRFYDAVSAGDVAALDLICAPDMKGHAGAGSDREALKDSIRGYVEAFGGLRIEVKHLVAEGDTVSAWVTHSATHVGAYAGVPATGASVRFAAWDLMRIRDQRIIELTQYCDLFTLFNQVGALPTAAPA
jgi:steroid delta-isomerase-like uncharacterized protein